MKKQIIWGIALCLMLLTTGCGGKNPEIKTEVKMYDPCDLFDKAAEGKLPEKRIIEKFNGTVSIGGTEIKLGARVKEQKNSAELINNYSEALEEYGMQNEVEFYCDDYETETEKRVINGVAVSYYEEGAPMAELSDGTVISFQSVEEMYQKFGAPDYVEELSGESHSRVFGIMYLSEEKRIDFNIQLDYDDSEEGYSYQKVISEKLVRVDLTIQ